MRRGNLDKISYILIIISALFTVISYVSDQLVIKYENNLRLNKFNYQNLNTEIKSIELISNTLSNLEIESNILVGNELRNKNFWIKHLILFESDKQKFVDHRKKLDIFIDDDFPIHNIKVRARSTTRDFIDNVVEIKNSYKKQFLAEKKFLNIHLMGDLTYKILARKTLLREVLFYSIKFHFQIQILQFLLCLYCQIDLFGWQFYLDVYF